MMVVWEYRVRYYNKAHTVVLECRRTMSDSEYARPEFRNAEEQTAERELRHTEGVPPGAEIEVVGWRRVEWQDEPEQRMAQ